MERKICRECANEDSPKHRLIYAGRGTWVCRNEEHCEARQRRFEAKLEAGLAALAQNDRGSCGHTDAEHQQMIDEIVQQYARIFRNGKK